MSRNARPFAALLWRELLELTRFSAPIFVLYALFTFLDVKPGGVDSLLQVAEPARRLEWLAFFNALVGALFGFYQTSHERQKDAWAFAVHRPVSATRVFIAKVAAGELMLLATAGIPYIAATIWVAIPGNVAVPFDWHMLERGIADILIGFVFHAAGLLVGARTEGVISRYLGFVAAIFGSFMITAAEPFWIALMCAAVFGAVLLVAGWATFVSAGDRASQPALGRVANAIVVLPLCAILYIMGSVAATFETPEYVPMAEPQTEIGALVTPDGRIVRVELRPQSRPTGDGMYVTAATDLQGRPLPEVAKALGSEEAGSGVIIVGDLQTTPMPGPFLSYRSPSRWAHRLFSRNTRPLWYYERTRGLISVYDNWTRRRTGWIGPDGFTASDTMPTRRFEGELKESWLSWNNRLLFEHAVYVVDSYPKPPRLIFRAPEGETIADGSEVLDRTRSRSEPAAGPGTNSFAVTTDRAVYIVDSHGQVEIRSPKPANLSPWTSVSVWRAPKAPGRPTFIWYPSGADSLNHVLEYRQGSNEPVARYDFAGPMFQSRYSGGGRSVSFTALSSSGSAIAMPSLGFFSGLGTDWTMSIGEARVGPADPPDRRAITMALILSVITMIPIWLIGRLYAFSTRWRLGWMALSLIAGPFTLLAMWLTTEFPAREKCGSCGKARVVNRETCEHCGAPFSAPAPDGTEVFA